MKISKNCCVRLEPQLHRIAKLRAYEKGLTMQEYIKILIEIDLEIRQIQK